MIASTAVTWYVARAGGLLAFALLTATTCLGLTLSGHAKLRYWPRFAVEDVHRFAGLLTGTFVVIHGGALLLDGFVPISLSDLLVPGTAPYRPFATAAGVVAAELLAALALTNHYKARLSYRFWRRAHYLNFAVWILALVHGITSGTDSGTPWAIALYLTSLGAVAGLTGWRALRPPARTAARAA
ncbi:MAG: ferric reductase-like transmembrane domain-containing protein [Actinomycetota bacterium]|nr:ferric reductase-like transmembrane domain-containing protein [Actinomycetota bacterium]